MRVSARARGLRRAEGQILQRRLTRFRSSVVGGKKKKKRFVSLQLPAGFLPDVGRVVVENAIENRVQVE